MISIETKIGDQSAGGEKSIDVEMGYEDRPLQAAGKDESASFQAVEIGNENGSQTSLVHVTSYRSTKNQNVAVDRVVRVKSLLYAIMLFTKYLFVYSRMPQCSTFSCYDAV